jgi:hypothetical protein
MSALTLLQAFLANWTAVCEIVSAVRNVPLERGYNLCGF